MKKIKRHFPWGPQPCFSIDAAELCKRWENEEGGGELPVHLKDRAFELCWAAVEPKRILNWAHVKFIEENPTFVWWIMFEFSKRMKRKSKSLQLRYYIMTQLPPNWLIESLSSGEGSLKQFEIAGAYNESWGKEIGLEVTALDVRNALNNIASHFKPSSVKKDLKANPS